MKIESFVLRQIRMPLVHFFETSFSRTYERDILLVEARAEGVSGWGEITAGEHPFYNEEWTDASWSIALKYAAPRVVNKELVSAEDVYPLISHIRGHNMARGGVEASVWDLQARMHNRPLWKEIGGGARKEIPCGVSIGIQDTVEQLFGKIETELEAGYQRIKLKIKPGWDVDVIGKVRERFPDIRLMADANSAYTLADTSHLKALDEFYLMMIEQPLAHDDMIDHAELQGKLATAICLDECIRSAHHGNRRSKSARARSSTSSWGAWRDSPKPNAFTTFARRRASPYGAAACWKQASDALITSLFPRCRTSSCRAMSPPANDIGSVTSSTPP